MPQENKIEFRHNTAEKKLTSMNADVEIAGKFVKQEIERAFADIRSQAKIDGFRHGKVPIEIIKSKFDGEAKNRAVENIVQKVIPEILEKEKFVPIDYPVVEKFDYKDEQSLKFTFTVERHPEFEVKNYKDIQITKEVFKITDNNIAETLDALRQRNASLEPSKAEKITEKNVVFVDYTAFDENGEEVAGVSAKNQVIELNSPRTLKEFKPALIDSKIGDEKDIKIEYPADYPNKSLAGKKVILKTKVNEIKEMVLPKLNDDFAKDLGTENIEDLKNKVKENAENEEKRRQELEVEDKLTESLVENNKFEVPNSLVDKQTETIVERTKKYMKEQGASDNFIDEQIKNRFQKIKEEAEKTVRLSYILNYIYEKENLAVTEEDMAKEKEYMKSKNPNALSAVETYFDKNKENMRLSVKEKKLFNFLIENANIKIVEKDMPLRKKETP